MLSSGKRIFSCPVGDEDREEHGDGVAIQERWESSLKSRRRRGGLEVRTAPDE